ncbi:MAG: RNA polymerase sigma factor [Planctomycetota bacterium]|jgi:RNA polymerase sigma-70 factor (ECF subfamily)
MHAEELVRHGAFLRRLATSLLRGEQEVDDIVQQAYLKALEHRPVHPGAWLSSVVRNLVFRHHRSNTRALRRERAVARSEALPCATRDVERLELQRKVVNAVLELSEPYRSVVIRRYLDELSPREIAYRTSVPLETVRTRLGRALRELRGRLDTEHANWAPALALLALRPSPAGVVGGVLMSINNKALIASMTILGVGVGVAGHAAFTASGEGRAARDPGSVRGGSLAAEVADLRGEVASLRQEITGLRSARADTDAAGVGSSAGRGTASAAGEAKTLETLLAIKQGERQLAIKQAYEELVMQGNAVVPEIVALLKSGKDQDYGGGFSIGGNVVRGYPRLRTVLMDVLRQIGTSEAKEGLLGAIKDSDDLLDYRDLLLLYGATTDEQMLAGVWGMVPKIFRMSEEVGGDQALSIDTYATRWIGKHRPPGSADLLEQVAVKRLGAGGSDHGAMGILLSISPERAFRVVQQLHKADEDGRTVSRVAFSLRSANANPRLAQLTEFYELALYGLCRTIESKEEQAADGKVLLEFLLRRQREETSEGGQMRLKYSIERLKKQIAECEKR